MCSDGDTSRTDTAGLRNCQTCLPVNNVRVLRANAPLSSPISLRRRPAAHPETRILLHSAAPQTSNNHRRWPWSLRPSVWLWRQCYAMGFNQVAITAIVSHCSEDSNSLHTHSLTVFAVIQSRLGHSSPLSNEDTASDFTGTVRSRWETLNLSPVFVCYEQKWPLLKSTLISKVKANCRVSPTRWLINDRQVNELGRYSKNVNGQLMLDSLGLNWSQWNCWLQFSFEASSSVRFYSPKTW